MAERSDNSTPVLALEPYDCSDLLTLGTTTASPPSNPPSSKKYLLYRTSMQPRSNVLRVENVVSIDMLDYLHGLI